MAIDLLIFDMDGVLIDVSDSYRQTILKTIELYLKLGLGFKNGKKFITKEEVTLFKLVGGFNNDWDLTSGILLYLISLSGLPPCKRKKPFHHIQDVVSFLQEETKEFPKDIGQLLYEFKNDLHPFLEKVKYYKGGLKGIRLALKHSWEGWLYHQGDLNQENLVQRLFQEVYLGEKFTFYYHLPLLFYRGKGLYLKEKLLFPRRILSSLHQKVVMGIASGRPRGEAELALKRFRIDSYFDQVVTLDDCREEEERAYLSTGKRKSFSKPHPYPLFRVIEGTGLSSPRCAYVGDSVDDVRAAQEAKKKFKMLAIGYIGSSSQKRLSRESLLQAGADVVIHKPEQLLRWMNKNGG